MSIAARLVLLVAIWLLAWGDWTAAHVIVGVVHAVALLVAVPPTAGASRLRTGVRPLGVVRLVAYLLYQLITSNVLVSRIILSRPSRIRTGVIVHRMASRSDLVITLVANAIALSPGTMTVEATRDPSVLHVHFLMLDDVAEAHRALDRLERLVVGAFGDPAPPSAPAPADPRPADPRPPDPRPADLAVPADPGGRTSDPAEPAAGGTDAEDPPVAGRP
jgi:multicomponent Na+:H+ antiporter subunit E